ncbi:phage tail protein [Amycolatopsis anabasis]|uniref:phage tail protein n=1 Tax=Amycolatopsis anabasis TaxID=1840409 RepID=UPI001C5536FD|nr:phage tail protein [Amycolatopsis anabasis]
MRAAVTGLPSRYPIGDQLPGMYADDAVAQRFTAGLDEVLSPVLSVLDNLPAYFDPALAPADFLPLLGFWVAADRPSGRESVARAVERHRRRGTRRGLAERLRAEFGGEVEIADPGGVTWSGTPGSALPAPGAPVLTVRLRVPEPAAVRRGEVERVVADSCPAHLAFTVEIGVL